MKINNFQGELTEISAKKAALHAAILPISGSSHSRVLSVLTQAVFVRIRGDI